MLSHHLYHHLPHSTPDHSLPQHVSSPTTAHIDPRTPALWSGHVEDFGMFANASDKASAFMAGLKGVTQPSNFRFVDVIIASFVGLMAFTLVYRISQVGRSHFRRYLSMGRETDQRYWMYNHSRFWPRMKKQMIYAPLFRQKHNKEIQLTKAIAIGTLPTRYHTILLFLYIASNLAYLLDINWHQSPSYAVVADMRGRSGSLATINLIPTILFALRNNPFIPLLGVSYDTFNLLHRWCARVMVVEATVHTLCWAANSYSAGGQAQVWLSLDTSTSYLWGFVAMIVFGVMFLLAFGPIRHGFYETFLNIHRIFAAVGLAGVYVHLDYANLPQVPYLQLCFALWFAELVWRTGRIAYHNFSRKHGVTRVTVEALPGEACRVTFDLSRPWEWKPGCHVHAYLPSIALWSSHPFSVAWAENKTREKELEIDMPEKMSFPPPPTKSNHKLSKSISDARRPDPPVRGSTKNSTITTLEKKSGSVNIALPRDNGATSVSLVMRARTGMTRKLYDKAAALPSGTFRTWGAIEGPYGGHESMSSYGTVILFAGGVGITHCVGYVHHLIQQYQAGVSSTQKILLVWSVPNTEALEWVRVWMDKILKMEGRRDVLRIQLFVTKPRHRGEVISNTGSVQMFPGRCNAQTILKREMQERIGAMGVTVCGPGAFSDTVRAAVREVVDQGSVDFIEEAFTY